MRTLMRAMAVGALIYAGCIAAAQYQPRRDTAQYQANTASQSGVTQGGGRVTNSNTTQQDNRTIEGQPPFYTFWNAAIDKALLLLLIWQSTGHRSTLNRMANGHSNGHLPGSLVK